MTPSTPSRQQRRAGLLGPWAVLPVVVRDLAGGVLLLVLAFLPLGISGVALGELERSVAGWVPPILIAGQTLGLAFRRTNPAVALAIVGVSFGAAQLVGADTGVAGLGLFVALYSVAAYQRSHRAAVHLGALAGYVLLAVGLHAEGSPERLLDWATFLLVLAAPWFIGQLVRRRLAEQATREAEAAEEAVRRARSDLARDLHDIVTHHVTAIVVQADSAAYLDDADVRERAQTLESIGSTGRRALHELRALLGALEQTPDPAPDHVASTDGPPLAPPLAPLPGDVASLVDAGRAAGYPVTLVESGPVDQVSQAVGVTLYRIAQEALTNAMKHAPGAPVEITLTAARGTVELVVVNAVGEQDRGLPGRGRRGMTQRASLLGGTLEAAAVDGRFTVRAVLDARAEP